MNKLTTFILLFAVLLGIFFAPLLLSPRSIPGNFGDVYLHYYPLKYLVSEHLINGKVPLWNPYIFTGEPLLANPQSAVLYPASLLFYFLPLPAAFTVFFVAHFFLAGLFFFLLLQSFSLSRSAGFLGAMAYVFSAFLVYKVPAGHPAALSGYIWLPLVMLFMERLLRAPSLFVTTVFSLALAFLLMSGHTFPLYIVLAYMAFHTLYHGGSAWKALVTVGAFFILFSAVQLVPTLELSQVTETANWPDLVRSYSLPLGNLSAMILPNHFGNVADKTFVQQANPSFFFERYALYFGLVPLALALAGLALSIRRKAFFFPLLALTGLVLALGFYTPVYRILYSLAPAMEYLRVPARFYYLTLVSLCVLAAIAWSRFVSPASRAVKLVMLLLVFADLFWWGHRFIYPESMEQYRRPSPLSEMVDPAFRIATEPEVLPANKSMLYHHYNLNGYEAILLKDFTRYIGLQEKRVLGSTGLARIDLSSPLARGLSVGYRITDTPAPGDRLLAPLGGAIRVYEVPDRLPRVYFTRSLTMIRSENVYDEINYLAATRRSPDEEVVLSHVPRGFPLRPGRGEIDSVLFGSDRIVIASKLAAGSALVISDVFYPGWQAWAAGKRFPVQRGNKVLRTVLLPAGDYSGASSLYLLYRPVSWRLGLYVTLLFCLGLSGYALLRARTPAADQQSASAGEKDLRA